MSYTFFLMSAVPCREIERRFSASLMVNNVQLVASTRSYCHKPASCPLRSTFRPDFGLGGSGENPDEMD
jgi:hypothetical protein